jgi:polyisoprenoid-binding protein YceI
MSDVGTRVWEGVTIPAPGTFTLDPAHTRIGFWVRHLMVSKVRGRFSEFSGSITIAENPLESSAELTMKTASIDTGQPQRDDDLRSGNFLEAEKYPEVTFRSTRIVDHDGPELTVLGDLTIKDVTRPVEFKASLEGVVANPWGKQVLGFSITGEIDREDFGITYNMALEAGGVMIGKIVKLEIEGEAVRND